jgi:hypothetical protein
LMGRRRLDCDGGRTIRERPVRHRCLSGGCRRSPKLLAEAIGLSENQIFKILRARREGGADRG